LLAREGFDLGATHAVALAHHLLGDERPDVRRNRVVTTTVDDPRTGLSSARVVAVDHLTDELRLPREVAIVGRGLDTRGDELRAVDRVGPTVVRTTRAPETMASRAGRSALSPTRMPSSASRIDDLEIGPHLLELCAVPAPERPSQLTANAVGAGEKLCDELAGEAARAPNQDIEWARGPGIVEVLTRDRRSRFEDSLWSKMPLSW